MNKPSLAIVVPCYNEQEVIEHSNQRLHQVLNELISEEKIAASSKVYYVDDGSRDSTWEKLLNLSKTSKHIVLVRLSRNKGHQNALYAGLCETTEDAVVSIDADLQDDPENIKAMVDEYINNADVVYGVRNERSSDSFFKRFTAEGYYHVMNKMGVDLVFNHADFRLMSRRALDAFKEYPESNLFLRGIVREIGFKSSSVEYQRKERLAGESKYPLRKMLSFAWDGITSFSTAPLRLITILGITSSIISLACIIWVLCIRLISDLAIPGWASILLPLLFIGSVQLLSLGVIGEYLAKLYKEVKKRPKYHVSDIIGKDKC